jgi:hypothetical protein
MAEWEKNSLSYNTGQAVVIFQELILTLTYFSNINFFTLVNSPATSLYT